MGKKSDSLRSQFKATSIKKLKKVVDEDDAMVGVSNNEYLNLEDGKTLKIRIFPGHPGLDAFYVRRKCYWLSFEGDNGSYRSTVLDSKVHGGTELDLVEEYVKAAKKKCAKDSEKIEALTGTGPKSNSLNPQYSWLCYADKVEDGVELRAKIWEFKKMVRDALNKLSFSEDEDDVIETDPFTDPDEGLPVLVKYNKQPNKKKGENFYEVSFPKKPKARPLTDEELEYFASLKPLNEVIPTYSMRDFEKALEGLQNFDEEHEIGLFDDDDWLEMVEKVKAQYDADDSDDDDDDDKPKKKKTTKKATSKKSKDEDEDDDDNDSDDSDDDEDDEEEKPKKSSKKAASKSKKQYDDEDEDEDEDDDEDSDSEDDEFTDMERDDLKKYIKKNGLDITVKKSMSDDDLRDAIRAAVKSDDSDDDDEDDEDEEDEKPAKKSDKKSSKKSKDEDEDDDDDSDDDDDDEDEKPKSKVSLDDIRKKLKK